MASTSSAFLAAVAWAFIAAHRSWMLRSEVVVVSDSPAPPPVLVECPPCRLGADAELSPLREVLVRLALHRGGQVECCFVVVAILTLTGLVTALRGIFRRCCSRNTRVEATVLRINHGDRRIQRA